MDIYPGTKSGAKLGPKNFLIFFWLQLVPGTTIENKNKKKHTDSAWYQIRGLPVDFFEFSCFNFRFDIIYLHCHSTLEISFF
jgi:hypothetical protein